MPFTVDLAVRIRRSVNPQTTDSVRALLLHENTQALIFRSFPTPEIEKSWRSLLARVELPSHYAAPEFLLEKHLSARRPFAVLAMEGGVMTGMHGPHLTVSGLPVRAQVCLDHPGNEEAIGALVSGFLAEAGSFDLIEINSWTPLAVAEKLGFKVQQVDGPVVLDLTQPLDALFKGLNSKRRNIQCAIRNNIEFTEATDSNFSAYYEDVYSRWRQTPRKKILEAETTFEGYDRRFRLNANRKLFLARVDGKTVAGVFLRFHEGGLAEYSAGSSLDEYLHLRPNDFLQWKTIEWAQSRGFKAYSLGGANQFHRAFGGAVIPAYRYLLDRTFLRNYTLKKNLSAIPRKVLPARVRQYVRHALGIRIGS